MILPNRLALSLPIRNTDSTFISNKVAKFFNHFNVRFIAPLGNSRVLSALNSDVLLLESSLCVTLAIKIVHVYLPSVSFQLPVN